MLRRMLCAGVAITLLASAGARADVLVRTDGRLMEGKVVSSNATEVVLIPEGYDASATKQLSRNSLSHVYIMDEHGGVVRDDAAPATRPGAAVAGPVDPVAPPIAAAVKGPTYYVIPLHGEVGATVLASALEKSLVDAEKRKPTVVVLDIDSPGGLVEEAKRITTVLHKYNKKLRIVALTNQDLSAAAVVTLSAKEIYVKSSSTIGAATSYVMGKGALPADVAEKMQSVWRAVARNSAEEGGHEPMLADAMIDNDLELHWETVNGKPVVKEGAGDHMICRKGKVLTLTSHEAVDCGLATGEADDFDELGKALKLEGWTEMKGLGTLLAEALPKRVEAYKTEMERVGVRFMEDLEAAAKADPSQQVTTVRRVITLPSSPQAPRTYGPQQPYRPQPGIPQPGIPRPGMPGVRPGMPGYPGVPAPPVQQVVTEQSRGSSPATWKGDSLACVVALHKTEKDLEDGMALATAYGQATDAEFFSDLKDKLGMIRAVIYDNRNKYVPALPAGALRTEEVGAPGTRAYVTTGPAGKLMVGLRYAVNHPPTGSPAAPVIVKIDPIFSGLEGSTAPNMEDVVAKEGYVVGGLTVDTDGHHVLAVKVIFVRYRDGHVVKSDAYTSDWLGTPDESKPTTVGGNGELVVGTCGATAGNLTAIGLLVVPAEGKK